MSHTSAKSLLLTALMVVSVVAGSAALAGTSSAAASDLRIVSGEPVKGTGTVTVQTTVSSTGAAATFKVKGPDGTVSNATTVTDGGPADQSSTDGVIEATLDFGAMFDTAPASGTGLIAADQDTNFSFPKQTYDTKRQVSIDSTPPTAVVTGGSTGQAEPVTAQPGDQVKLFYTATDVPQKIDHATMEIVAPDGSVQTSLYNLQAGEDREIQITIPSDWSAGEYNLSLTVVDEVGYTATDTLTDGLVVETTSSSGSATANNLEIVSAQPVKGTGELAVRATVSSTDADVSFKVQDASGTVSSTRTVTDGGSADGSASSGVVETTLDLDTLFDSTPASGTAIVYAAGGSSFSIPKQTFDTKRQVAVDSVPPSAEVTGSSTGDPVTAQTGDQVKVFYTVTDVPQAVSSVTMEFVGPSGTVQKTITGLQAGTDRGAQFTVPSDWSAGEYNVTVTAVDEAGYTATDTYVGGLVVKEGSPSVSANNLRLLSGEPIKGNGTATVDVTVSTTGAKASFKVQDANGTISATKTVTDGGSADGSSTAGVVKTTLDFGAMFDSTPASGTAVVYAAGGVDSFSIAQQTFDTKQQVAVDADAPTAVVTGGSTNEPTPAYTKSGTEVQIAYRATDVPQKIDHATMRVIGPDGNVRKTLTGLQGGNGQNAQFIVPSDWNEGKYTVELTAVDEVGHTTTDTYVGGLIVDNTQPAVVDGTLIHTSTTDDIPTKIRLDVREKHALDSETVGSQDFIITNHTVEGVNVTLDGNIVLTPGRQTNESSTNGASTEGTPIINESDSPSVYLNGTAFIADMANNRLYGPRLLAADVTDESGAPQNPDEVYVTPDPVRSDDLSAVTVGVNFTQPPATSADAPTADPPESGTIYVRFEGPNGTTVVRSMPANTSRGLTEGTFDLTGAGLSDGEVRVTAKIVDDSGETNPHGWDAPTFFTLDTSTG